MNCTCHCEEEAGEGSEFWSLIGMAVFGLLVADLYANPFGWDRKRKDA